MKIHRLLNLLLLFTGIAYTQDLSTGRAHDIEKQLQLEKSEAKRADLLHHAAVFYLERLHSKKDLDSAEMYNRRSLLISKKLDLKKNIVQCLLLQGQVAMLKGNSQLAMSIKNKALQYAHSHRLLKEEAMVYKDLALDLPEQDIEGKAAYFKKAIALYKHSGAHADEAESYFELAGIYHNIGESDSCITYTKQAIKIKKNIKNNDLYREYAILAQNYWTQSNHKNALAYALEAEKLAESQKADGEWLHLIYNLLAVIHAELYADNSSIVYYKKAITVARKNNDAYGVESATLNAAMSLYNKGDFRDALALLDANKDSYGKDCNAKYIAMYLLVYCELKRYEKAKPFYEQLLKCNQEKVPDDAEQKAMYFAIAQYLLQTGQARKSYPYIDKLRALAIRNRDRFHLREIEFTHFEVDSATGNYAGAVEHFKKYKSLSDSIFNISSTKQLADLQLKYETNKKDKDIKLLTQHGKLQDEKIRYASILRYVFIGGLTLLGVFVGLLYTRARLKQRTNKALQLKQEKINEQNEALKKLLHEKEWLLKEIHHRVKNNLQIVISLLNTQSAYLENKDALNAIQNSQHRMHAMSLIHQKLYQSDNLASIDMSWYIYELVNYLKECFEDSDKQINYEFETEPVELDVTQAVPLGLILNEAISNAIKYAFTTKDNGNINITLAAVSGDIYRLVIADDGVGLPEGFESIERESLGMDLMIGLADQLDGTFELVENNGLTIVITFTKKRQFTDAEQAL